MRDPYQGLHLFFGDLHSHSTTGYGHGSAEDAFRNARLQLDFACMTAHAVWPDMPPSDDPALASTVAYHRRGFGDAARGWQRLREIVHNEHRPGAFVPFLGFEWHSLEFGDHHIVYDDEDGDILRGDDLEALRRELRVREGQGRRALLVPHHIGYRQGYRGINWRTYMEEFSPVVEIMSMHGCSESDEAPYPMLHTMGPRDGRSTYQYGLAQGHRVGAIGSTDHHSAHPGSYGHGRLAVWAEELTRDALIAALYERRCYALTGDRIGVRLDVNGSAMGAVAPHAAERNVEVTVDGGARLSQVELLRNNEVIHAWQPRPAPESPEGGSWKVLVEVGWGPKGEEVNWDGRLEVIDGRLLSVEPRFRGPDIVAPASDAPGGCAFSTWGRDASGVHFTTRTWGNPATSTAGTQALCLEIAGDAGTRLAGRLNGAAFEYSLAMLAASAHAGYLGGFLTPAYRVHRAIPDAATRCSFAFTDRTGSALRDWYTVRVRQANDQWAWSSPVWVSPPGD